MNLLTSIIFMAFVGAFLGASTNHLAVKMLFRPYNPVYIGKWQLPFTPGLIPKRRDALAVQLGKTVTEYLLTPETFRKKFFSPEVRLSTLHFIQTKAEQELFNNHKTLQQWLELTGFTHLPQTIEAKVDAVIAEQFHQVKNTLSTKSIRALLPEDIQQVIDRKVPEAVEQILAKGEDYFLSSEGEKTIKYMLDDFLSSKGSFGGMIQMLVGDSSSIVDKIQQELIKFLRAPGTKNLLVAIFSKEWEKIKERPVMDFLSNVELDPIVDNIQRYAKEQLALDDRLAKTVQDYWPDGNNWAKNDVIPKLVDRFFVQAENKLEDVLKRLNLQEVVREQVDVFPVERLEELVLGISKKELQMITYLGGLIGGLIGIAQGIIVFLTN
ncbi:DUF445 domain-containing protein [Solibacillus sp. FSL H8-0538]|uniref:DUF445 domain-containing protein n=1 Tax=Solibacillus sp. FSL H8-0538 TaxID=2921400 RepID=UPI0030F770E0